MANLKNQLKKFPNAPGVYFFKDKNNKILYVGKASNLKQRVKSYFGDHKRGLRIDKMVLLAKKLDFQETETEINALFLESELIKRYRPVYNVDWKDEKNYLYLKISNDELPGVFFARRPMPDKARYFGPFIDATALRKSIRILRKIFPIRTANKFPHKICFYGHLKMCPCFGMSAKEYQEIVKSLVSFFEGRNKTIIKNLELNMKKAAKNHEFERAAGLRDKYLAFLGLKSKIVFTDFNKTMQIDEALLGLKQVLGLQTLPKKIEAYDISNISGTNATGSLITFENGIPFKQGYKKFKIRGLKTPNDYAMLRQMLERRFAKGRDLPDLVVVDGGKGQLQVALNVFKALRIVVPVMGIAKEEETIVQKKNNKFILTNLEKDSKVMFLLQRIRDEAHRFAVTYHRSLRSQELKKSALDEIFGIGEKRKKELLKHFGSIRSIKLAKVQEIAKIVKQRKLAEKISKFLNE